MKSLFRFIYRLFVVLIRLRRVLYRLFFVLLRLKHVLLYFIMQFGVSFVGYKGLERRHWLLAAVYLLNRIHMHFCLHMILLTGCVAHKLFTDAYICDRSLSVGICFATIVLKIIGHCAWMENLMFLIIVYDTITYGRIKFERDLFNNYHNTERLYDAAIKFDNVNLDTDDDDDDNNDDNDDDNNETSTQYSNKIYF